jgi:mono/diheme cytochrome c family protein
MEDRSISGEMRAGRRRRLLRALPALSVALPISLWAGAAPGGSDLVQGEQLYLGNCARCHGANLEGQPDWKRRLSTGRMPAPPHNTEGHSWHHPDRVLFETTKFGPAAIVGGGYQSDMEGFADKLTDDEIRAVLDYIKSTWPERERQYQADRTLADEEARQ